MLGGYVIITRPPLNFSPLVSNCVSFADLTTLFIVIMGQLKLHTYPCVSILLKLDPSLSPASRWLFDYSSFTPQGPAPAPPSARRLIEKY
ncbi:hypothetical protein J6590_006416 [Homalodisca vitripennis]|nr:hypothetical protein J6590_006416 [Homalodisca vitripennis]